MSEFKSYVKKINVQFDKMNKTGKLFRSSVSGKELWDLYLSSFKPEHDPVFRDPESSTHNCNMDNSFFRRYSNIIAVDKKGNIMSLFDVTLPKDSIYYLSNKALSTKLKNSKIKDVFFESYNELKKLNYDKKINTKQKVYRLGIENNHKQYTQEEVDKFRVVNTKEIYQFNHFYVDLPNNFVSFSNDSIEKIMGTYRDKCTVFQRAIEEIPIDTLNLVKDLINQGSLLDGTTHSHVIDKMLPFFNEVKSKNINNNWYWVTTYDLDERLAKFKNTLIGVLCTELAEGKELNEACKAWNKRVDPSNYMKVKSPITEGMKKKAIKDFHNLGYSESDLVRRYATLDDINVSEIYHSNVGDGKIKNASIFDNIKPTKSTRHKRSQFDKVEEVGISKFMKDILPTCSSIEVFLENRLQNNLVTMTTIDKITKNMFKWNNTFSWTYNGNLAGKSQLRDAVSSKGGRVDGAFRFSHSWNELERNQSLMDLHVFMPGNNHKSEKTHDTYGQGRRVGWNNRKDNLSGGIQDVDYTSEAPTNYIPVENITFPDKSKMPEGKYICKVHNWAFRTNSGKGKAEIEFDGNIFQYEYPALKHKEWVTVAEVTLKDGIFDIKHMLPETNSSKELWGLDSNEFHKVDLVCLSPNHWGDNNVGNKHYFFMLNGCKTDTPLRSFHNENLTPELLENRKFFDIFGDKLMLEPTDKQLAGLGFNSTVKDELIVKCKGNFNRTLKIKFNND